MSPIIKPQSIARCKIAGFYVGPMVNFSIEKCYHLDILSSNMDFAVIYRYSNFCKAPYFIFCAISIRLEKTFSDVRFE